MLSQFIIDRSFVLCSNVKHYLIIAADLAELADNAIVFVIHFNFGTFYKYLTIMENSQINVNGFDQKWPLYSAIYSLPIKPLILPKNVKDKSCIYRLYKHNMCFSYSFSTIRLHQIERKHLKRSQIIKQHSACQPKFHNFQQSAKSWQWNTVGPIGQIAIW